MNTNPFVFRRKMTHSILVAISALTLSTNSNLGDSAAGAEPQDLVMALIKRFHSEWVEIQPGKFAMGSQASESEGPVHMVTIGYKFRAAKYEVPQNLYEAVMGENPSLWKGPRNSVEMTTFDDAMTFCRRATEQMRDAGLIDDKHIVRLPTEAEWEYFARAGTKTPYSFGKDEELGDYAWFTGNASGNDPPVGAKKPNPWGLYDVHGYLWEWCLDPAHANYDGAPTDGSSWTNNGDGKLRVMRGGSWKDKVDLLTSSVRSGSFRHKDEAGRQVLLEFEGGAPRSLKDDAVGFRCVLVPVAQAYSEENDK